MKEKILIHKEIPIPKFNEYPLEQAQKRAQWSYAQALPQVNEKRAKYIEEQIPLKALHYAIDMTFGKWRLTGPSSGQDKSPLDMALDCLKPYIDPARWTQFKREFKKLLTQSFLSIGWSLYNPVRVKEKNVKIKQLLNEFALKEYDLHLEFVLHPETAEFFLSPRMVEIRSKIYEHFTGQPVDKSKCQRPQRANDPRKMDMHLDIQVARK